MAGWKGALTAAQPSASVTRSASVTLANSEALGTQLRLGFASFQAQVWLKVSCGDGGWGMGGGGGGQGLSCL